MITHITVEDAAKLISRLTNANEMQALTYIREAADRGEIQAATALSTLQAKNEKLRAENIRWGQVASEQDKQLDKLQAELKQVKQLYESEKENFIDFACSGVPNLSPYCLNRHPDCVDERGWCKTEKCRGFSRERGQKEG